MKKYPFIKLLIVLGLTTTAILLLGAKEGDEPSPQVTKEDEARLKLPVAKIDGKPITLGELEELLSRQSPMLRVELNDATKRREFLDRLVNMELLAKEAARRGYAKNEEVESVKKNQLASLMHRQISTAVEETEPDDEALRKYYDEHHDNYHKPEKVRARHIFISDKAKAEKLLADIKNKKKISQHEFRRLAQENSEDEASRLRGGDLTFFSKPNEGKDENVEVEPEVAEAAFKIKKNGDIYPQLVKSSKGYHIVMRTGHRDKMDLSFEDARDRLKVLVRREMRKDNIENAIEQLKTRFDVEVSEQNLKYVVVDLSVGPPEPNAKGGLTPKERKERQKMLVSEKGTSKQTKGQEKTE